MTKTKTLRALNADTWESSELLKKGYGGGRGGNEDKLRNLPRENGEGAKLKGGAGKEKISKDIQGKTGQITEMGETKFVSKN